MKTSIVGIGTWLPQSVRTNDAWPASFAQRDHKNGERTFNDIPANEDPASAAILDRHLAAEALDPFLGAKRRHVADVATTAAEAEAKAAVAALSEAGIAPDQVDLIFSYSAVPDRIGSSNATELAYRLGAWRAMSLAIDAACASALAHLDLACAAIESGRAKVVLLTQSHLFLRTIPLSHPASPGVGDGATALVVARGKGLAVLGTFGMTHGEHVKSVLWIRGHDDTTDLPWWQQGGPFFLGSRDPSGVKALMRDTITYGAATVREAASRANVKIEHIGVFASVQPRGFFPSAIATRLGLSPEAATSTYDEIAHVGPCGPVFNLAEARAQGRLFPGAFVALYAQGMGFTRTAALLEVS